MKMNINDDTTVHPVYNYLYLKLYVCILRNLRN